MMTRFHIPAPGVVPWQAALADPEKHWKDGKSAKEMAKSWVAAEATPRGLPAKVAALLDTVPALAGATLLLGVPEHKVELPPPGRPSQNDLWAVLRTKAGLVSMTVEGKSGEPFDRTIGEWLNDASPGKVERLRRLCQLLDAPGEAPPGLRYQLFHRTASAIIEAQRWGITTAVMLVHSFGGAADEEGRKDYEAFGDWLGMSKTTVRSRNPSPGMTLHLGWVVDSPAGDR